MTGRIACFVREPLSLARSICSRAERDVAFAQDSLSLAGPTIRFFGESEKTALRDARIARMTARIF